MPAAVRWSAELCTVAHHQLWLGQSAQMIDQLLQTNSTVIAKASQLAILTAEQGVVDLLPPCVHGTRRSARQNRTRPGPWPPGWTHRSRKALGPGNPLGRGHADAQAGKAARPVGHGDQVYVIQRQRRIAQHTVHQRHQGAAVGQAVVLIGGVPGSRRSPPRQRRRFWRSFQCQYFHSASPSCHGDDAVIIVLTRAMDTVRASGGRALSMRSDHSTAHTPPRAR